MTEETIPLSAVRLMMLKAQGLLSTPSRPATKEDVLGCIRRIGALQIDTINIVARAPYLILWSRLGDYDPVWLEELLAEGKLFEYWSHAACFLPIEDYALYRQMMERLDGFWYNDEWRENHADTIERVLDRIRMEGPLRSADFERTDGVKGTWWNWKEEKRVLEYLHTAGKLMISKRVNFQRIYDLRERVLPDWDDAQALPLEEARDMLAVRAVRALGIAPARWVYDYFRLPKKDIVKRMERLADAGLVQRLSVEGWNDPAYLHPENRSLLEWAAGDELHASHTTLLSPFDPLVSDRARARELFHFDYTIECYLPEAKRRYGYFSLPILREGDLVGRLDAKAYRKEKVFEVRSLHLEDRVHIDDALAADIAGAVVRCAAWHKAPRVEIRKTEPARFQLLLEAAVLEQAAREEA